MMRMIAAAVAVVLAGPALGDDAEVLRQRLAALQTQLWEEEAARLAAEAAAEDLRQRLAALDATLLDEEAARLAEAAAAVELGLQLTAALASRMQAEKAAETAMSEAEALRAQIKALGSQLNEALAYETGRFQMQVAGAGANAPQAWILDTKTGGVRFCQGYTGNIPLASCSEWEGGHPRHRRHDR